MTSTQLTKPRPAEDTLIDALRGCRDVKELKAACKGKRWLVVLDDVWDRAHEQLLNCVDTESASVPLRGTVCRRQHLPRPGSRVLGSFDIVSSKNGMITI